MEKRSIADAPRDRDILLLYPYEREQGRSGPADMGGWIEGWWFSSPKEIDDGWETVIGFIGDPTHWAELPTDAPAL